MFSFSVQLSTVCACLVSQHTVVHDYDNLFIWLLFSVHVIAIVPFRPLYSARRSNVCVASPGDGDTAFCKSHLGIADGEGAAVPFPAFQSSHPLLFLDS